MKLKYFFISAAVLLVVGPMAFHLFEQSPPLDDPFIKSLTRQLKGEGFVVQKVETTWLGRYKIEANSDKFEREIVVAPGTGTFLRDNLSPIHEANSDGEH